MRRALFNVLALLGLTGQIKAEQVEYEGALYQVHRVPAAHLHRLDLRWLGADGKPLGGFPGLQSQLQAEGKKILFATNAGIFERGPKPCGLTICASKEGVPLNLNAGEGNFYLKPNGVFYLDDQAGPGVVEASEYPRLNLRPRIATQSGPLLLRQGVIHPAFNANSPNLRQRSGVGVVSATKDVVFVMSEREDRVKGRVTFHQLSRFFLHLGCQDALYLDGDISEMIVKPSAKTVYAPNTFAAMFVELDQAAQNSAP